MPTACQMLGLTPTELARAVGVSASAVARWEAGTAEPRGRAARMLAELLAEVDTSQPTGERCAVADCRRPSWRGGLCPMHQRRRTRGECLIQDHDRVGEIPSGWGLLGVVDRDDEAVLCHECGRWLGSLVQHLRQAHGLTVDEHRDRHELPATIPLASQQMSQRLRETSRERIGSPEWQRFEAGRAEVTAEAQRKATEASSSPRLGTRAARAETARRTIAHVHRDEHRWRSRLAAVAEWWQRHGRPPSRSSGDPAEVSLARWTEAQRRAHRRGTLADERRSALECAGIDLDPGQGVTWWNATTPNDEQQEESPE
ncbi:hypothetical protein GCM10027060_26350 [Nesterenkonia halophila]